MISIKSEREIESMRRAGEIAAAAREMAGVMASPGITTAKIDKEVQKFIVSKGAVPSFLGYNGFPGSICISVNDEVIHGIPGRRKLKEGDIVSLDVGAFIDGFHGDCAATFAVGNISKEAKRLIKVTEQSFYEGLKFARQGFRISDISHEIQAYVESNGFSVVRDYIGHGIGARLHEEPEVPNYGNPGRGPRLLKGMTIAIEPMVNQGTSSIRVLGDRWTVITADRTLSAHYENTVLITGGEPEILTVVEGS